MQIPRLGEIRFSLFGASGDPVVDLQGVCKRSLPAWPAPACRLARRGHDPLHPNSNEINAPSGVAERTPFFVKAEALPAQHQGSKTYGSSQSVSNPLAANSSEIKWAYGITEWTLFCVKLIKAHKVHLLRVHLLSIDLRQGCLVVFGSNEVHPGTFSDSSQQAQDPEAFLSTNGPREERHFCAEKRSSG